MGEFNELVFEDIKMLCNKKDILKKYNISSDMYKKYYAEFLLRQKNKKAQVNYAINKNQLSSFNNDSVKELYDLKNEHGVYLLYKDEEVVYVGVSKNLKNRIPISISSRVSVNGFSYICTDTLSDAYILEVILINIIKPYWNSATFGGDKVSFEIPSKYSYKDLQVFR
jgi:hypothetical protein